MKRRGGGSGRAARRRSPPPLTSARPTPGPTDSHSAGRPTRTPRHAPKVRDADVPLRVQDEVLRLQVPAWRAGEGNGGGGGAARRKARGLAARLRTRNPVPECRGHTHNARTRWCGRVGVHTLSAHRRGTARGSLGRGTPWTATRVTTAQPLHNTRTRPQPQHPAPVHDAAVVHVAQRRHDLSGVKPARRGRSRVRGINNAPERGVTRARGDDIESRAAPPESHTRFARNARATESPALHTPVPRGGRCARVLRSPTCTRTRTYTHGTSLRQSRPTTCAASH